MAGSLFSFPAPPPIGTRIRFSGKTGLATLVEVAPYTRRDGEPSFLLRWRTEDGRTGTTGLAGNSLSCEKP